jgi:hypothetical protein
MKGLIYKGLIMQQKMAFQFIEQQDCFQCDPHFVTEPGGSLT